MTDCDWLIICNVKWTVSQLPCIMLVKLTLG